MAARRSARAEGEKGLSTVEVVMLTPLIFLFALTVIGLALYAQDVSQVQEAASDAARMASLQDASGTASSTATRAAGADLGSACGKTLNVKVLPAPGAVGSNGPTVAMLETRVTCTVNILGLVEHIVELSYAPVDTYGGGTP